MDNIIAPLQDTLKTLYRQALDADTQLDKLSGTALTHVTAIFDQDSGFSSNAKRFMPYVEEIARDWQQLQSADEGDLATQLAMLVKKIEMMLSTLQAFKKLSSS